MSGVRDHVIYNYIHLGLNVSNSTRVYNCGCVVDGDKSMAVI